MIAFGYDVLYNSFTVVKVVRPWKEDNMAKFDDFDLDIRKVKGNQNEVARTGTGTFMTCGSPGVCDTTLVTMATCEETCILCGETGNGCSDDTCSDCHSYCGAACRR